MRRTNSLRTTDAEVRNIMKDKGLVWIGGEYINSATRNLVCMDENEYICVESLSSINRRDGINFGNISPFKLRNPYSLINFQKILDNHNLNYTVLRYHINNKRDNKIECIDNGTGYIVLFLIKNITQKEYPKAFHKRNPYSLYNLKLLLLRLELDYSILDESFNSDSPVKCLDNESGYIVYFNKYIHTSTSRPIIFGMSNMSSVHNMNIYLDKNNRQDIRITDIYTDKDTPIRIRCICPNCGNFWYTLWTMAKRGQYCKVCNKHTGFSGWSKSNWVAFGEKSKNYDSFKLYKLKCWSKEETFYKIGITYRTVKDRFTSSELPYNFEVVEIIKSSDGGYIWELEKELHRKHKAKGFKYVPNIKFQGMTECFSELID